VKLEKKKSAISYFRGWARVCSFLVGEKGLDDAPQQKEFGEGIVTGWGFFCNKELLSPDSPMGQELREKTRSRHARGKSVMKREALKKRGNRNKICGVDVQTGKQRAHNWVRAFKKGGGRRKRLRKLSSC